MAGEAASKGSCTDIRHTFRALAYTFILSIPIPLITLTLGYLYTYSMSENFISRAVGGGLIAVSGYSFVLLLGIELLRPQGVAIAHISWPQNPSLMLRKILRVMTPIILIAVFVAWAVEITGEERWKESLGRCFFMIASLILSYSFYKIFFGKNRIVESILEYRKVRLKNYIIFGSRILFVGLPLMLMLVSLFGFYYTAIRLSVHLFVSITIVLSVSLLDTLIHRWLLLARRKLAREQARQRRELLKAHSQDEPEALSVIEEELVDLDLINDQNRRLIRGISLGLILLGLFLTWANMVPAMEILNRVEIGNTTKVLSYTVVDAAGIEHVEMSEQSVPITLQHLSIAILIGLVTLVAGRNISGFLEITVLQRFNLQAGERYAITSIVRYVLVGVGVIFLFNTIGLGWGRVQWLVAAMGIGLGFGLQEIFANFMSGIILLFERPIRLGDVVTIGNIHGTVTRIRIRATTITDFDRKELVVPNKDFVSGQLINWTLSDSVLRVVIPVGVSYSSDIHLTKEVLLKVAKESERVIAEPKPTALFIGFGDSALEFELRVFCLSMESYILLKDEMHMKIMEAFRENGIEFAFPQRDIHIKNPKIDVGKDTNE